MLFSFEEVREAKESEFSGFYLVAGVSLLRCQNSRPAPKT